MKTLDQLLNEYRRYLQSERTALKTAIARHEDAACYDDANLDKIRLNIVEVFSTLASADEARARALNGPDAAIAACFRKAYLMRFQTITAPWSERREKAAQHGDTATTVIEEIKLQMAQSLKETFEGMGGCV